ncbi:MAG: hypothetical protein SGCHY_001272 [Lobulomycetales sp.]
MVGGSGPSLKWVSLAALVVQNSALVLLMKQSLTVQSPGGSRYAPASAVLVAECIKLAVCVGLHMLTLSKTGELSLEKMYGDVLGKHSNYLAMSVPAVLYLFQNNLQYAGIGLLDAATFQVTYQLKILTTAVFSVSMLRKVISRQQWLALGLLTAGVALVQLPPSSEEVVLSGSSETKRTAAATSTDAMVTQLLGLGAVFSACILSGIAGVWFERCLKGNGTSSVWVRNIQLSMFSMVPGVIVAYISDGPAIMEHGFSHDFTGWTYAAILCQALGGLIVALVVKHADSILKGFATSISIVLSCIASVYLYDFTITNSFLAGTVLVLLASHLYASVIKKTTIIPMEKL